MSGSQVDAEQLSPETATLSLGTWRNAQRVTVLAESLDQLAELVDEMAAAIRAARRTAGPGDQRGLATHSSPLGGAR